MIRDEIIDFDLFFNKLIHFFYEVLDKDHCVNLIY